MTTNATRPDVRVRFTPDLHERLRTAAFEGRTTMAVIVRDATRAYLDALDAKTNATPRVSALPEKRA